MLRLIVMLGLVAVAIRSLTGRWPWEMMALPARKPSIDAARILLGVDQMATRGDILDAHRRLIARVHPDRGGTSSLVHEANDARDLLLSQLGAGNKEQA